MFDSPSPFVLHSIKYTIIVSFSESSRTNNALIISGKLKYFIWSNIIMKYNINKCNIVIDILYYRTIALSLVKVI